MGDSGNARCLAAAAAEGLFTRSKRSETIGIRQFAGCGPNRSVTSEWSTEPLEVEYRSVVAGSAIPIRGIPERPRLVGFSRGRKTAAMKNPPVPPQHTVPPQETPALAGPVSTDVVYDSNGVDRSPIRWMLSLEPGQRLQVLQDALSLMPEKSRLHPEERGSCTLISESYCARWPTARWTSLLSEGWRPA